MRGDFEYKTGGYPIAAMPTGVVRGESYVMDVTTMNKLLDATVVKTEVATQVAGYLNQQLVEKKLEKDWTSLNAASLERYEAIKHHFPEVESPEVQAPVVEESSDIKDDGSTAPSNLEPEEPPLVQFPAQSPESAAALAAIIAEANGPADDDTTADTGEVEPTSGDTVPEVVVPETPQVVTPAPIVPLTPVN